MDCRSLALQASFSQNSFVAAKVACQESGKFQPAVEIWARRLADEVQAVVERFPECDPDDVRRTLICLQMEPLERLNHSLRRGRGFAAFRK